MIFKFLKRFYHDLKCLYHNESGQIDEAFLGGAGRLLKAISERQATREKAEVGLARTVAEREALAGVKAKFEPALVGARREAQLRVEQPFVIEAEEREEEQRRRQEEERKRESEAVALQEQRRAQERFQQTQESIQQSTVFTEEQKNKALLINQLSFQQGQTLNIKDIINILRGPAPVFSPKEVQNTAAQQVRDLFVGQRAEIIRLLRTSIPRIKDIFVRGLERGERISTTELQPIIAATEKQDISLFGFGVERPQRIETAFKEVETRLFGAPEVTTPELRILTPPQITPGQRDPVTEVAVKEAVRLNFPRSQIIEMIKLKDQDPSLFEDILPVE